MSGWTRRGGREEQERRDRRSKERIEVVKMGMEEGRGGKGIGFEARSYGLIQFVPFGSAVSLLHWR